MTSFFELYCCFGLQSSEQWRFNEIWGRWDGYDTIVGKEGHGLSQGQKQRILIARAIYKVPEYLFFDEATNALDAQNERIIVERLQEFYQGRTVVVIAHRLSTVKNTDQIIVLDDGKIVEHGKHEELINLKGYYYQLVKNQLELGNWDYRKKRIHTRWRN